VATNVDKFLEPSEIPASSAIPLGAIIPWWPTVAGTPGSPPTPPTGYEYCDGTAVVTGGSPYIGLTKPSLMITPSGGAQQFARGADTVANAIGGASAHVAGGANSHQHGGSTSSVANHSHNVTSHSHTIPADGSHTHVHSNPGGTLFGLAGAQLLQTAGSHSHSGSTGNSAPTTDFQGGHSHTLADNSASSLPAFNELAWIVRVL